MCKLFFLRYHMIWCIQILWVWLIFLRNSALNGKKDLSTIGVTISYSMIPYDRGTWELTYFLNEVYWKTFLCSAFKEHRGCSGPQFEADHPLSLSQGSTDRKVGPRGPSDPVRSADWTGRGPAKFLKKRTKADRGPRKFWNRGPGRTADRWNKKSWSVSYEYLGQASSSGIGLF